MDTEGFDEENLAKRKERCDMIEQLAIAEEENRKLGIRADKLEHRLESETRKAERRKRHIDLMGAALTERRNQLHERGERIAELEKQVAVLRAELADAEVPTERERQIIGMWPRFEDGERVWYGDAFVDDQGGERRVAHIALSEGSACITDSKLLGSDRASGEAFKRPAPEMLDADGVPIKVGDTVWHYSGFAHGVVTSIDEDSLMGTVRYVNGSMEFIDVARDLTHTRPDSWERLEEDAKKGVCEYAGAYRKSGTIDSHECDGCRFDAYGVCPTCEQQMALDIIRRAKALAGAEVE